MRFGQWPNWKNLKVIFLAENMQLAESYIIFNTFRPVTESNIFFLYVLARGRIAYNAFVRFGQLFVGRNVSYSNG